MKKNRFSMNLQLFADPAGGTGEGAGGTGTADRRSIRICPGGSIRR